MNIDERRAKQLHYDVMGIALAIRGHAGPSGLFEEIDAALTDLDWRKLVVIQNAFDLLSTERQQLILGEMGDPDAVGHSITIFERMLRTMAPRGSQRTA
jgi:hypothetical protein